MPEVIEIIVETEDSVLPSSLNVSPEIAVDELIKLVRPNQHELFVLVVEDEDLPKPGHLRLSECNIRSKTRVHCHPKVIHYKVDGEPQETKHHKLTPVQIMRNAKFDPKDHYLIRLIGKHEQESYKDKPEHPIHIHNGMRFTVASCGPTPVS